MLKSILIFEQYVEYWLSIVVIHFSMRTVIEFHSTESRIATSEEIFRSWLYRTVVIMGGYYGRRFGKVPFMRMFRARLHWASASDITLIKLLRFLKKPSELLQAWVANPIDQIWCNRQGVG